MFDLEKIKKIRVEVQGWITQGLDEPAVVFTEKFGEYLADRGRGLSTSQIRNVFGEVRRIQMKGENNPSFNTEVLLLKPKLSYAKSRANGKNQRERIEALAEVLTFGIEGIFLNSDSKKFIYFENFAAFFEAILAYHRANGGK